VKRADIKAHHPDVIEQKLNYLREVERIWKHVLAHQDCLSLKDLKLTGADLIADGMTAGPQLGQILQILLDQVLEYPERNDKELLLKQSRELRLALEGADAGRRN
jgi:tRNA nucleotidyltransferase (CCA-adding enzyme)